MARVSTVGVALLLLLAVAATTARAEAVPSSPAAGSSSAEFLRTVDSVYAGPTVAPAAQAGAPRWLPACADPCGVERRWRFLVAPYIWTSSVTGDAWIRGQSAEIDAPFLDWAEDLTFAVQLYAEARYGRWWGALDGTYSRIEGDADLGANQGGTADYSSDLWVIDARIGYRVWGKSCCAQPVAGGCCDCREHAVFGFVGARYWTLDQEVKLSGALAAPQTREGSSDWIDPFVGVRYVGDLSRRFSLDVRADVGGFGLGDASDFTWQAAAYLGWKLSRSFGLILGYRAIGLDRVDGSGADRNGFDGVLHGPAVGFAFRF